MPFGSTASIVKADVDNMLRGLFKDNSDNSHMGDTDATNLAGLSMTGGTMGATGAVHVIAAGTTTGTTDTKTIRLAFSSTIATVSIASGAASDWGFDAWVYNTATNAQRIFVRAYEGTTTLEDVNYLTLAIDTTAALTIKCTGQLGGTTDTITQTIFNIDIVQRT